MPPPGRHADARPRAGAPHPSRATTSGTHQGGSPSGHQEDYELLQLFDRLSLYFCLRDLEGGEAAELQDYTLEPVGPWRVKLDPFPFAESPGSFSLVRRVIAKNGSLDVLAAPPQETAITIDAG